jgi:hypothetical protein
MCMRDPYRYVRVARFGSVLLQYPDLGRAEVPQHTNPAKEPCQREMMSSGSATVSNARRLSIAGMCD